jgi:mannosyltransferase OCH1-like enzyme
MALIPTRFEIDEILSKAEILNGVPKIYHQIWYNKTPVKPGIFAGPTKFLWKIQTFEKYHSDWIHIIWTNDTIDYVLDKPENSKFKAIVKQMFHAVQIADVFRLVLMTRYGGMYCDLDYEILANVEPILESMTTEEGIIFMEHDVNGVTLPIFGVDCVINGCLIARKENTIYEEIIMAIGEQLRNNAPETEVLYLTGPRLVHKYLYGPATLERRPIWKVREYEGNNKSRLNNLTHEYLTQFMIYPRDNSSGWAKDVVRAHFDYYALKWAAIFILILVIWCAFLFFFSTYNGVDRHLLYPEYKSSHLHYNTKFNNNIK